MIQYHVAMDHKKILKLKFDLYLQTRAKVERILGRPTKQLIGYQKNYQKYLKNVKWSSQSQSTFLAKISPMNVVFVGDFHAQPQSGRTFLRLLRLMKPAPVSIALECFRKSDQKILEMYLNGELNENDFLRKIRWEKNWGFPFETIRPIIKWSLAHSIPVYGINTEQAVQNLRLRDQKIAKSIAHIVKKSPERKLLVLIGDFHISPDHLPKMTEKISEKISKKLIVKKVSQKKNPKIKTAVIYQTPEDLYFKIAHKFSEVPDIIQLNKNSWATMSVLPWVKWQEYLIYLESESNTRLNETEFDMSEYVVTEAQLIFAFLDQTFEASLESVLTLGDEKLYQKIQKSKGSLQVSLKSNLKHGVSFYSPEMNFFFLARNNLNHIARMSTQYVFWKMDLYPRIPDVNKATFLQLIWLEMCIYFFTKLSNPKKKSDTLLDIRAALNKDGVDDRGRESLTLALEQKLVELNYYSSGQRAGHRLILPKRKYGRRSYQIASEILGGMLGEKLYTAYRKKIVSKEVLKQLLTKNTFSKKFESEYFESIEIFDQWPSGFKSKFDQI